MRIMPLVLLASTLRLHPVVVVFALVACIAPDRGSDTVVIASGADLESANPLTTVHPLARQVQRYALFVTLAQYDSALRPAPYYARGWRWSADRRVLTFQLDPALSWHDGVQTTARDAAFSIDAARDPATGFFRRGDLSEVVAATAESDTVLALSFARPQSRFPAVLCELPIAPVHLLGGVPHGQLKTAPFAFSPVGNGPYRFVERHPREWWSFEANPNFPLRMGGPPRLRRVVVAVVDEPTTKFAGLASGDVDLAGISPTMVALTRRDPALEVLTYPIAFSTVLVFNSGKPLLGDVRVRRALAAAIHRQRLVDVALSGLALAAEGAIPQDHPYFQGVPNADDAGAQLDSAGWPLLNGWRTREGERLSVEMLSVGSGDNALEQLIQADFRAIGVELRITQLELGAFLTQARASEKRFDLLLAGIPGDVSLSQVSSMFESSQAGGALDYAGFHRPALDTLFLRARSAADDVGLKSAWQAIDTYLQREAPVSWLYHATGVQGKARRLQGVRIDLRGELASLTRWYMEGAGK